jgi:hypothetical protein
MEELKDKNLDFYKEINVEEWLQEKNYQSIRFEYRKERKENGVYHSLQFPAIEYNDGTSFYYIEGVKMEKNEWEKIASLKLTKRRVNKIKNIVS